MSELKEKALVAAGAVGIAAVVVWALSKKDAPPPDVAPLALDASPAAVAPAEASAADAAHDASSDRAKSPSDPLPHEHEVAIELGIVAPKAQAEKLAALAQATPDKWPLSSADCGGDCAKVRQFLADTKATVETMAAADWILPPRETMPTVARTVPEGERASLYDAKQVLVVHVQGEDGPDHMPLRASFGLTAALARELRGYVHDEATHRIDTAQVFAERLPKVPVGTPFFVPESLLVELHPLDEDDLAGPYRLLTLGMARYGMPDLEMRGFHESDGGRLAAVLNAVASKLARGERGPEVTVTLADVATVARKKPEELTRAPEKAKEAKVRLSLSERMAADPDNDVYRIEAPGDGDEDAHAALLATLYGEARVLGRGSSDPALLAAEARAKKLAPAAAERHKKSGGKLSLRVPFAVPGEKGKTEVMWMTVDACDAQGTCKGKLASRPVFIRTLSAGAEVSGKLAEVSDYLLELPDGTKEGGETIPIVERGGR